MRLGIRIKPRNIPLTAVALTLLAAPLTVQADLPISFDIGASVGYDHTAVNPGDSVPSVGALGLGLTAKYGLSDWFAVGLSTEYQSISIPILPRPSAIGPVGAGRLWSQCLNCITAFFP